MLPTAKRSGLSDRISTRTAPRRPLTPRTSPTTSRSVMRAPSARSDDLERDRLPFARGDDLEQSAQRLGDAAVAPDDLAHVVFGDVQLDHTAVLIVDRLDRHGVRVVYERARNVFDERLCRHRVTSP